MEATCRQLEECMNQDPSAVGRARVAAETFAQVANSFVEEISWKTLASLGWSQHALCHALIRISIGIYLNLSWISYRIHQRITIYVSSATRTSITNGNNRTCPPNASAYRAAYRVGC